MLRLIVTLLAASYASAALHNVCHSNYQQLTEAQVVKMLVDICDRNDDGIIKEAEVVVGFAEVLGTSLPLPESSILDMDYGSLISLAGLFGFRIDRADFISSWHDYFHDSHDFIAATFDAFDDNHDGFWSMKEIDRIVMHIKSTSDDGDGILSRDEFVDYFTAIYENC